MNWYKKISTASFISEVQISESGTDWLTLWINGRKYEYKNVDPSKIKHTIHELKSLQSDKRQLRSIGGKLSSLIKSLEPYLIRK